MAGSRADAEGVQDLIGHIGVGAERQHGHFRVSRNRFAAAKRSSNSVRNRPRNDALPVSTSICRSPSETTRLPASGRSVSSGSSTNEINTSLCRAIVVSHCCVSASAPDASEINTTRKS